MIPTIAFGIPGSAETAVFLGAMVLHGLEPGPTLLNDHEDVVFTLVLALTVACVLASIIVMMLARPMAYLTLLDGHVLVPIVTVGGARRRLCAGERIRPCDHGPDLRRHRLSDDSLSVSAHHLHHRAGARRNHRAKFLPGARPLGWFVCDFLQPPGGADPDRDDPDFAGRARHPVDIAPPERRQFGGGGNEQAQRSFCYVRRRRRRRSQRCRLFRIDLCGGEPPDIRPCRRRRLAGPAGCGPPAGRSRFHVGPLVRLRLAGLLYLLRRRDL